MGAEMKWAVGRDREDGYYRLLHFSWRRQMKFEEVGCRGPSWPGNDEMCVGCDGRISTHTGSCALQRQPWIAFHGQRQARDRSLRGACAPCQVGVTVNV